MALASPASVPPIAAGIDRQFEDGYVAITTDVGGIYRVSVSEDAFLGIQTRRKAKQAILRAQAETNRVADARDTALTELATYKRRNLTPVAWYFSGVDMMGIEFGTRLGCDDWRNPAAGHQLGAAKLRVCPGGNLTNVMQVEQVGVGQCGITTFRGICETP